MRYYTGWEGGYNGDDFEKNRYTIFKEFFVGDIRYVLYYNTGFRLITVRKHKGCQCIEYSIATEMLEGTYHDSIAFVCQKIIDFKFPENYV